MRTKRINKAKLYIVSGGCSIPFLLSGLCAYLVIGSVWHVILIQLSIFLFITGCFLIVGSIIEWDQFREPKPMYPHPPSRRNRGQWLNDGNGEEIWFPTPDIKEELTKEEKEKLERKIFNKPTKITPDSNKTSTDKQA
jgi:hypothetical protein